MQGYYSQSHRDNLVVYVEQISDVNYDDFCDHSVDRNEEVATISDYYKKYRSETPNVKKFTFNFDLNINGMWVDNRNVTVGQYDALEVAINMVYHGPTGFNEYMDFLHSAYKEDLSLAYSEFAGNWKWYLSELSR